jgi:hypothetical protein
MIEDEESGYEQL